MKTSLGGTVVRIKVLQQNYGLEHCFDPENIKSAKGREWQKNNMKKNTVIFHYKISLVLMQY